MKRILAVFLVLALMLPAAGLGEGTLKSLYQSGLKLLFDTHSVTLNGDAEFSLDGVKFKTAHGKYVQDGESAYQKLVLLTPRADGAERETGYTIFDQAGDLYILEAFRPGVYFQRGCYPNDTILRNTVYLSQLTDLGLNLTDVLEERLGDQIKVTEWENGSTDVVLSLDGGDGLTDAALNLVWDYVMKRFFFVSYDDMPLESYAGLEDFITVTEGICYTVKHVALQNAEITVKTDDYARLKAVKGDVTLLLSGYQYTDRPLHITFNVGMSHYGDSAFDAFDAEKLGVTPFQYEDE